MNCPKWALPELLIFKQHIHCYKPLYFGSFLNLAINKWNRFWYFVTGSATEGAAIMKNLKHVGVALKFQTEC